MAQRVQTLDLNPDVAFGTRARFQYAAMILQTVSSDIDGNSANNAPYVGVFVRCDVSASPAETPDGTLEIVAQYTDGSESTLISAVNPFDSPGASIDTDDEWYIVRANGKAYGRGTATPTAATAIAANASAASRERLPLDSTKTLAYLAIYWTPG